MRPARRVLWEPWQDTLLKREWRPGRSNALSGVLGKTVTAINVRASALGLTLRHRELTIIAKIMGGQAKLCYIPVKQKELKNAPENRNE